MSEENEDPTRGFMTRDAYDKEQQWEENKKKLEHPGYSYVRHTSDQYISGMRNASDGYAWGAMQVNIADLKGAMGEGSDYDDSALKRELEKQGKAIEANTDAIADKSDKDHTHPNITDPYDDAWIQPEIDKKSDKGHTHDISHNHDAEYQPVGDYADKNHLHNFDHTHDDYLTSGDLPDPYDDTQIRDDFAAADQNLQNQIDVINDAGYDDSGIKLSLALEEQARIAGDDALSVKIDGKADDDHIHDPIDLTHNHNSQYQPIGDYATKTDLDSKSDTAHSHPPQDLTHDHDSEYQPVGNYAEKDHDHPPQDLTHNHDAEYAPVHEHPYSDKDHTHPPQDLTHNHDSDYQPVGDYATNQTVAAGDQDLQDQIDAISNNGGYNDSWIEPAINTGDANTLQGAKQYTDEEVAKIIVPDVSDFATTNYVDAGDAAVEAKIPNVSNFATSQELTDGLASKSDTTHDHDEFTHTHDFTHDHDGQYALEHDHPYAAGDHTHDTSHTHTEYAETRHNHDGTYQPTGDYALDGHTHDVDLPAGTIVSDTAPEDPEEGATWYDTVRLELFVFAEDAWLPCSPLGARVEAGEILQAQIVEQVTKSLEDQKTLQNKVDVLEGSTQYLPKLWQWNPESVFLVDNKKIYWKDSGDKYEFYVANQAVNGSFDFPQLSHDRTGDIQIYYTDGDNLRTIARGDYHHISVAFSGAVPFFWVYVKKTSMQVWRPTIAAQNDLVHCHIGGYTL